MSFQIRADAGSGAVPVLYIHDAIGRAEGGEGGFTIGDLQQFLDRNRNAREIIVEISSTGGDAYAGLAIHDKLVQFPVKVRTRAVGIVASAASIIFLAGDVREVSENAEIMIHEGSIEAFGSAQAMHDASRMLEQLNAKMMRLISQRTGQPEQIVKAWMAAEKWLGAHDAKSLGFATHVSGAVKVTASLDVSRFRNTPYRVKQLAQARMITAMHSHPDSRAVKQSPEAIVKKHGQPKSLADLMSITNGRVPASAKAKPKATTGKAPTSLAEVMALTNGSKT
ncbi:Clp protease ClpP [Planctomicrobium sp. SH527]|uniref:Clp protease ClpP n=1 Tax=Planctomicrobium sp. SH527 TaxID=3448123 RepID=UPI003F5C83C8